MSKRKSPKFDRSLTRDIAKRPAMGPAPSVASERPQWSFALVDGDHEEWGINGCNAAGGRDLLRMLKCYETMYWGQIDRKDHCHFMGIDAIDAPARARLQHLKLAHREDLYQLHIQGCARLWGFRSGRVFHILWWDQEHKVYEMDPTGNAGRLKR